MDGRELRPKFAIDLKITSDFMKAYTFQAVYTQHSVYIMTC
jgi:hypothetical protein